MIGNAKTLKEVSKTKYNAVAVSKEAERERERERERKIRVISP